MICVNGEVKIIKVTQPSTGGAVARAVAAAIDEIRTEGEEIVVVAANHSVATQIARLAAVLIHDEQQTERLVEGMFVPSSTVSPATALQAQRNAEARQELIEEFGLYDSDQVAEAAGSMLPTALPPHRDGSPLDGFSRSTTMAPGSIRAFSSAPTDSRAPVIANVFRGLPAIRSRWMGDRTVVHHN